MDKLLPEKLSIGHEVHLGLSEQKTCPEGNAEVHAIQRSWKTSRKIAEIHRKKRAQNVCIWALGWSLLWND